MNIHNAISNRLLKEFQYVLNIGAPFRHCFIYASANKYPAVHFAFCFAWSMCLKELYFSTSQRLRCLAYVNFIDYIIFDYANLKIVRLTRPPLKEK